MPDPYDPVTPPAPPPIAQAPMTMPIPATSGKAVASMVLGIVSCITPCLCYGVIAITCGILAIVFSKQAFADVAAGRAGPGGNGMAKAGKICGIVGLCLAAVVLVVLVVMVIVAISQGSQPSYGWRP